MNKYSFFLIVFVSLFLFSCVNEEGQGGVSIVQGKVFKVLHPNDNFTLEADTFPAAKEDVYIVYGDEPIYGDKMETGYDGFYRFQYLTKGTYKVYAYSTLTDTRKVATTDTVTVEDGETKNVQNIYIHEGKSYETSYIKGTVDVKYYNKGSWYPQSVYKGYDVRAYIRLKGAVYHFDEARTGLDGAFVFQNLKPGIYEVFVFSEVVSTEVLYPVVQEVIIDSVGIIKLINDPFHINVNV